MNINLRATIINGDKIKEVGLDLNHDQHTGADALKKAFDKFTSTVARAAKFPEIEARNALEFMHFYRDILEESGVDVKDAMTKVSSLHNHIVNTKESDEQKENKTEAETDTTAEESH